MANGAGIGLVPCIAVVGSIIWCWVIFPFPIGWMGPGIEMTGRVGTAGGCDTAIEVNSARGSMAVLTIGDIVSCIRSVQSSGGEWNWMGRTHTAGMTTRCYPIGVSEVSREAAGSTRQRAGTGTCGLVTESATGAFRILGDALVRRIIGGIRIVGCPLPVCRMRFGRRMTGRVGAVPQGFVVNGRVGNEAAIEDVLWAAVAVSAIKLVRLCCRAVIAGVLVRQSMGGGRPPVSRVAAGFKATRPCTPAP